MHRPFHHLLLVSSLALLAAAPLLAEDASATVKVGLGIEKFEIKDASDTFKIAPGTKLYAWTRVSGCPGSSVTISFQKDGEPVFDKELEVPHSPYRTNACRTFHKGDEGNWTAKVSSKEGKELAAATFKVEITS